MCATEAVDGPAAVAGRCEHTADGRTQSDARGAGRAFADRRVRAAREVAACAVSVEGVAGHAVSRPTEPARHGSADDHGHQTGSDAAALLTRPHV